MAQDPRIQSLVPRLEKLPKGQIDNLVTFLNALLDAQEIFERLQRGVKPGRPRKAAKKGKKPPGRR